MTLVVEEMCPLGRRDLWDDLLCFLTRAVTSLLSDSASWRNWAINTRSKEILAQDSRKKAFLAVMRKALPSTFWLPAVRRSTQSDRLCQGGFLLWELSRRTQDAENCPSGSSWCCPAEPQRALAWSHRYKVHKPEGNHRLLHPAQVKVVNTSPGDSDNHE